MRHALCGLVAAGFAIAAFAHPAAAAKKIAFVAGIDRYENLTSQQQLRKAVNDARAMSAAFKTLGFEVIGAEDVTRIDFLRRWQQFLNRLEAGDVAAFFFAGHGVEVGGLNYLLPRDVPRVASGEEEVLKASALSLTALLDQVRGKRPQLSFHVVDACRDNPFVDSAGRSIGGGRGLARVEPAGGSFVMFSAGAGQTALDRLNDDDPNPNSVYTRTLLRHLMAPGQSLTDIAREVRREVLELARGVSHVQTPAYYDEVVGRFCPAGCDAAPVAQPSPPSVATPAVDLAAQAWASIKDTSSVAMLEAFATRFPSSVYADFARARIAELKRQAAVPPEAAPPPPRPPVAVKFGERGQIYRIGQWQMFVDRFYAEKEDDRGVFVYFWTSDRQKGIELNTGSNGWWRMWDGQNKYTVYTSSREKGILQGDLFSKAAGSVIDVTGKRSEFTIVNKYFSNHTTQVRLLGDRIEITLHDKGRIELSVNSTSVTYRPPDGAKTAAY